MPPIGGTRLAAEVYGTVQPTATGVESAGGVDNTPVVRVMHQAMLRLQIAETHATNGTIHVMALVAQTISNV